jgi:hypothetical protein
MVYIIQINGRKKVVIVKSVGQKMNNISILPTKVYITLKPEKFHA